LNQREDILNEPICIISGSKSDDDIVMAAVKVLTDLGVPYSKHVCSAHRDPERLARIVRECVDEGCRVFICIAGMAAHLPGVVAGLTTRPVIGVPASGGKLMGVDALLSIVQMPRGTPVGCVAIDGGANAAILACQILATSPEWIELRQAIDNMRQKAREA
jgi:5-(carboxyamino)imidazole ribonucleotide mutase